VPYQDVLSALAHPTRRRIYEQLRRQPRTVGELARLARVSQPGVSQHLNALRHARLVRERADGNRRIYHATPEGLADLKRYVESLWDDVLNAFAAADPAPPTSPATRGRRP
jgi:DNA-binding transcriptional ArsR family regulator